MDIHTVEPLYLANLQREFNGSTAQKATESRKKTLPETHVNDYHKNSLKNMRAAINRHLKGIHRDIDIVRDKPFTKVNDLLNAKLKSMTKSGMYRPTHHQKLISQK